jgi:7-carboxy-7-deazaguanine synthase
VFLIELYKSLQGESSFSGLPCIFIRLAGCNLRCSWCDSEYTFTGGKKFTEDEVVSAVQGLSPAGGLVEITGGEPMLQEREVVPLMQRLLDLGYTVLIETSGERALSNVPKAVHKIVDVKCPDSGAADTFRLENLETLTSHDEIKFVISSREDYEFARDFTRQHSLAGQVGSVILSPAFRKDAGLASINGSARESRSVEHCLVDPRLLAEWILADSLNVRLGFQIHKFIWQPSTKGV